MAINDTSKVWDGVYSTFSEATAKETVFEEPIWLDKIIERARQSYVLSEGDASVAPVAVTSDYALPFVAAIAARRDKKFRILDFGGGMGTSFIPLIKMLPSDQPIDFVVVENEVVCNAGREFFKNDGRITFRNDLPASGDRFDIIHCGSSLHYVDDWKSMLDQFSKLQPEYILFADLPAADNKSFVTSQLFHGQRIPVHFWNLEEFVLNLDERGYELIFMSRYRGHYVDQDSDLPTSHFEPEYRLTYISQLVFRRTTEFKIERMS